MNTWDERDLPVLKAIVRRIDESAPSSHASPEQIQQATGLSERDVQRALAALRDVYLEKYIPTGNGTIIGVMRITPEARQVTGEWPRPDLVEVIDRLILKTQNPDERTKLQRVRDGLVDLGTRITSEIVVKLATSPIL